MVRGTEAKVASLVLAVAVFILYLFDIDLRNVGICRDSSCLARFVYPFFHVNILHLLLNVWCILSLVFMYEPKLYVILVSYGVAVSFPVDTMYEIIRDGSMLVPTVGLSGVCFSAMGIVSFSVRRKLLYHTCAVIYLVIGFLSDSANGWLHLYCYAVGLFVGFLNMPVR